MIEFRIIWREINRSVIVLMCLIILPKVEMNISSIEIKEGIGIVPIDCQVVVPDCILEFPKMEMCETLIVVMELMFFNINCLVELF